MGLIDLFRKYKCGRAILITTEFSKEQLAELSAYIIGSGYPVTSLLGNLGNTNFRVPFYNESAYLIFDTNGKLHDIIDKIINKGYNCIPERFAYYEKGSGNMLFSPTKLYIDFNSKIYEFDMVEGYHEFDDMLTKYNTWHIKVLKDKAKELN